LTGKDSRRDLNVFVLDTDCGIGVVTAGQPSGPLLSYSLEQIKNLTYKDLSANRKGFLNLKPVAYLNDFLQTLKPIHD
jgi:hypothetical protein